MTGSRLERDFYARSALVVAKDCIGKLLVHEQGNRRLIGRIVEVEAYTRMMLERRRHPKSRRLITNGPGELREGFGITRADDGLDLCQSELYLAWAPRPERILRCPRIGVDYAGAWAPRPERILRCPRIGVDYAGAWATKPYRFLDPSSPFVSVKPPQT